MRLNKLLAGLALVLLAVAFAFSRLQLERRLSVIVGLLEVALAGLIGILFGLSAVRKN